MSGDRTPGPQLPPLLDELLLDRRRLRAAIELMLGNPSRDVLLMMREIAARASHEGARMALQSMDALLASMDLDERLRR